MTGRVAALFRYPVKGFTPERLEVAQLEAGRCFPCDRLYAVEDGPSGFDPDAPVHISKQRFTVLAKLAQVARVRTAYHDASGVIFATADGRRPIRANLTTPQGREAFAEWLAGFLGAEAGGKLKVLTGPGSHRFMDHPQGHVSVLNLATVRDIEARTGRVVDPHRFRANIWVEGWPAWVEMAGAGQSLWFGEAETTGFKPIVRCAAIEVDPQAGVRDFDLVKALFDNYGHMSCGLYVQVAASGPVRTGDPCSLPVIEAEPA